MGKLEKIYFTIVEWGIYIALFTPLVLFRTYFFPYVSPKTIFFRVIVDIIFIAYILLVISTRRYLPRINALTIAVTVFVGVLFITSLTGINFFKSFWSVFERMTGLLTFFHLYVFFIVLTGVFRERKYWERIFTASITVGVLVALYALFAKDQASRSGGTIGNIDFLAFYLSFNIFFAVIFFFIKRGWWRLFYALSFGVMMLDLLLAKEMPRGSLGAIFFGFIVLVLGYMIFSGKKILKKLAPALLIFFILAVFGLSQTKIFKEKFVDISKDIPGESRVLVWQTGIDAWKERPWLGWGLENFNIPFAKYFNPQLPLTADVWYDRVHNIVLDIMVQSGIVGLISYLSIFGVAIFSLLKICPKVIDKRNLFAPIGMIAALLAYLAQNIWVFDMISSYLMFFLSLAFIVFLTENKEEALMPPVKTNKAIPILGGFLIILVALIFYYGNIQPARASKLTVQGLAAVSLEETISSFQKAIAASPISIIEAPEQFSKKIDGYTFDQRQDRAAIENGFALATAALKKSIEKNPVDYRLYLVLGRSYNNFFFFSQDQKWLQEAESYLNKAMELSPKNQQTYWSLAQTKLSQQKPDESVSLLQKAIDLEPRYAQSSWYLALAYKILGKNELALEKVKDAEKAGFNWKGDLDSLGKVIDIYQNLKNDAELIKLYPLAIVMNPKNAQFWAAQAVALANLGRFQEARVSAQKALELNPEYAKNIDEFLKSLPQ
ncbi:MAG: tetratricopeptide repeat protein [bacterium]|nr:tetratricopeptide repeat protein [bacterium]